MNRTRLVLSSVVACVLVTGVMSTSASGAPRSTPSKPDTTTHHATGHHGDDPRHGHGHTRCDYPPQRTPDVSLSGPASVRKGRSATLDGRIMVHECGLPGRTVGLYSTAGRGWFHLVDRATSDSHGNFTFRPQRITRTTYFLAVSAPGGGYTAGMSNVVKVSVDTAHGH